MSTFAMTGTYFPGECRPDDVMMIMEFYPGEMHDLSYQLANIREQADPKIKRRINSVLSSQRQDIRKMRSLLESLRRMPASPS